MIEGECYDKHVSDVTNLPLWVIGCCSPAEGMDGHRELLFTVTSLRQRSLSTVDRPLHRLISIPPHTFHPWHSSRAVRTIPPLTISPRQARPLRLLSYPNKPAMSSPPTYSANGSYDAYPQPTTRPGSVRHRKSSTIIPIASPIDELPTSPLISPARSTAILPDYGSYDASSTTTAETISAETHRKNSQNGAIPPYMHGLERRNSNSSSAAEEGEATPLLGEGEDGKIEVKWYEGPLLVAGVKFSLLFIVFTAILGGTFYFGLPPMAP